MNPLKSKIIERIRSEGPISFETFMDMALYHPDLGYYTRDAVNIGRAGDFYTSPHLNRVFGAMIGRQVMEMWESMGRPPDFQVVEMGAGAGYLAKDALGYLRDKDVFAHLAYSVVEINPGMRTLQQELLSEFRPKINWVSRVSELSPFSGCFVSNELLDAFPVRLIEMEDGLKEIYVNVNMDMDKFIEIKVSCDDIIKQYFRLNEVSIGDFTEGYRTEVNLRIKEWLTDVYERLIEGFVLSIDYGYPAADYYSDERSSGTLLCYYKHQFYEDPYQNIGEQDITAHVNFSSVKAWGDHLGLKTIGFCPQGTYLVSLGLDEVMRELYGDTPDIIEVAQIKGLVLPQGMGESHKVLIQYKGGGQPVLRGFSLRNQKNGL